MNESTIKPVSGVSADVSAAAAHLQAVANAQPATSYSQVAASVQAKSPPPEKSPKSLPVSNLEDVSLRFRVNEDTNEITVYVIDRASRRVLRTVPPEEFTKLQAGDLLQLMA
jgi:uncharacterized FlaG/YvyC family protein